MGMNIKYTQDMVRGKQFGRLTGIDIIKVSHPYRDGWRREAVCICECGNLHRSTLHDLFAGKVRSCGCYQRDCLAAFQKEWQGSKGAKECKAYKEKHKIEQ